MANHIAGKKRPPLPSQRNTLRMEKAVRGAYQRKFHRRAEAHFEHGHWWAIDRRSGAMYDAVDTNDGFDFEQVSEGDED